jgi:hypothetical protein
MGWILIVGGVAVWMAGVWFGPGLFFAGLVIETLGYLITDRTLPPRKDDRSG